MIGAMRCGITCERMIRPSLAPTMRAASTNSFSRSEGAAEREPVQPRADGRAQGDDEEECWEDHRQLYDSGNGGVGQAAVVAGGRSQDDSEDHHCNRREDRDLERDARSIEK